ncbi:FAD-dependent oxidoreductase [Pseudarthrobacter sp. DSP2-3-2b1]|uniref:FAD-dependent oxidoreductase n=1 Tax=Pseudarthrobacter sp. DSP2-3-2b1 TaxID=2804661 RepID=UPI003CF085ED
MVEVLIVGGGPVGLYLAALLLQEGVKVRILEQRTGRDLHSRAIGIHPPALAALESAGVADTMVEAGVQIRRGVAISGGRTLGSMSFAPVSDRFPFVLSLPQFTTETLLEERVNHLDSSALVRGARVTDIADDGGRVTVSIDGTPGPGGRNPSTRLSAQLLVAADGSRSSVRGLLGIKARPRSYPDHYVMGDFEDSGGHRQEAVLYLEAGGIVESFPLPGGVRRWVARVDRPTQVPDAGELARIVHRRTGVRPEPATNTMLSAFSPRSAMAQRSVAGRAVLIGDAAHEISPIGGQGMNLGWLDAAELAPLICAALAGEPVGRRLQAYAAGRRKAARLARWQSEVNMTLGRPLPRPLLALRSHAIGAVAGIPAANRLVARRFTMQ